MKRFLAFTIMIALIIATLAACGGGEDPAVAFCDALTEIHDTGPTIAALGEAADLAQIVQLGNAMGTNWQEMSRATEDMDADVQAAFAPYDEQFTAIPAITQETAMPVARASLDAMNGIAMQAYDELYAPNCQ